MSSTHSLPFSNSAAAPPPFLPSSFATPAFRAFLTRLYDTLQRAFSCRRPWPELAEKSCFSRPLSVADAASRVRKNLSYFRVNYLTVLATILAISLLSHPFSLLTLLSLIAAWLFLYLFRPPDLPIVIFGRTFSDRETLGILITASVIVIFLTSIGSLIMSSTLLGCVIVCMHGAVRVPEDMFLDEQDIGGGSGMFSVLSGSAVAAGGNMV